MRILHIVGNMDPRGGGPQEVIRTLLAYSPPGVTNEIATLDAPNAAFLTTSDLPIHALGTGSWYSPRLMSWLRANRSRFDGVLHHGLWSFPSIATLHTIAGHRPYMVFPHGMLDPYFKRAFPAKHLLKKWPFWLLNERWLLSRAERVLFTTTTERNLAPQSFPFSRWNPGNSLVCSIGSEAPPIPLPEAREAFFQLYPAVRHRRFLLFLGRIHPKKGCDLLVQAFAELCANRPALDLVIAGPDPGNWRPELQAIATRVGLSANRIHWPGMLQGAAKWGAFAACEAFVLTSHQENFGIAVVEALACGRPVLLTEPVNIAADLAAAGCALVAPDTLEGARSLLTRWIGTSPHDRDTMSANALATFAGRYNMRGNAAAIYDAFTLPAGATAHTKPAEAH